MTLRETLRLAWQRRRDSPKSFLVLLERRYEESKPSDYYRARPGQRRYPYW